MRAAFKLSTLRARFCAPSSSNPSNVPDAMQKGFLSTPDDQLTDVVSTEGLVPTVASSEDLSIHSITERLLVLFRELVPATSSLSPINYCECENYCQHRKATVEEIIELTRQSIAAREEQVRDLRVKVAHTRQQALSVTLQAAESEWTIRTRARTCGKICNFVVRPAEIVTGPNNNIQCVKISASRPYYLLKLLGRGGFSSVWEVYHAERCKHYAAKLTMLPASDDSDGRDAAKWLLECLTREVMLLKNDSTPTLLGTHDCFNWEIKDGAKGVTTIHDLCDCDLSTWMKRTPLEKRSRKQVKQWLRDVLEALDHLHMRRGVLHTDLKPQNLLKGMCDRPDCQCSDSRCKVADFGLHRITVELPLGGRGCPMDMSDDANWCGTIVYQPPEHLRALINREKNYVLAYPFDIWGLGVIALELLQGKVPLRPKVFKRDIRDIAMRVLACQKALAIESDDPSEQKFLAKLLAMEPAQRGCARDFLCDPFLESAD